MVSQVDADLVTNSETNMQHLMDCLFLNPVQNLISKSVYQKI